MSEDRKGFIYGRMSKPVKYSQRKRVFEKPPLPPRKPKEHRDYLLSLLNKAEASAKAKQGNRVKDAKNTLVAVKYNTDSPIKVKSLESKSDGVRVVYDLPDQGTALLDASVSELKALRKKIEAYGHGPKDKNPNPANNDLVAPIDKIEEAEFKLVLGLNLKHRESKLEPKKSEWFEFSCRGGLHDEDGETARSRREINEALKICKLAPDSLPEFIAAERIIFFINCSLDQAKTIFELTDCVFEIELVPQATLNWLLTEKISVTDLPKVTSGTPPKDAPSIVLLDSGINSKHPLLQNAVALEQSVHPEDDSPVDQIGHGTEMAGICLYGEEVSLLGTNGAAQPSHWLESVRLFTNGDSPIHSKEGRVFWPKLTKDAIDAAVSKGRKTHRKVYSLTITAEHDFPGAATSWSLALDQIAYNGGDGRLVCISIGNCKSFGKTFISNFPNENLLQKIEDPAHAANVITVGGFTKKTTLPPDKKYTALTVLARNGTISPHTRSGAVKDFQLPIKPDVVFEAGNFAYDETFLHDDKVPSLSNVSTSHTLTSPYVVTNGTSMSTALAAKFVSDVWRAAPKLRAETIRGLVVHSASWTQEMLDLFGKNKNDLLALCGHGVPSAEFATFCTKDRATIIIEDELSNAESTTRYTDVRGKKVKKTANERQMKVFKLPLPKDLLQQAHDKQVELRITLSYFSEPNSAQGRFSRGMDLLWDVQGPAESEKQFYERINEAMRTKGNKEKTNSFDWDIGPQRRRRGTIQSDRWHGSAVDLSGSKLVAVYPKYGWWNMRKKLQNKGVRFSLIVTVLTPGIDIYTPIHQGIQVPGAEVTITG